MNDRLEAVFESAIKKQIFPGSSVCFAQGENVRVHRAFGTTAYGAKYSQPVTVDTVYDVASLTKLFTATAFLIAARGDDLSVDTPLSRFFPEFSAADKAAITLRHLLHHNSGIRIAIQSLVGESPGSWVKSIADAELHAAPGKRVLYSCTNFFLLARVIDRLSGMALDDFLTQKVLSPLQMKRSSWKPLEQFAWEEIAPTAVVNGQGNHGMIHDEAARVWQEYSGQNSCGNSGLFTTSGDLARFIELWQNAEQLANLQILREEEIEHALSDTVPEMEPAAKRGWGWQIDAPFFMSDAAPSGSAGHAGFTGPTLWLSSKQKQSCIILNNRIYPPEEPESRFPTHRRAARWFIDLVNSSQ